MPTTWPPLAMVFLNYGYITALGIGYFQYRGDTLIILLAGGDKESQERDIMTAKKTAADWSENDV